MAGSTYLRPIADSWCRLYAFYLQALADLVDKEQSGAAAAAESSRRDAEVKAKEESDLVHECQVRTPPEVHLERSKYFFVCVRVISDGFMAGLSYNRVAASIAVALASSLLF